MGQISLYEFKQNIKIVFFSWEGFMTPSLSLPRKRYEEEKAKYYDIKRTFWNKIVRNLFVFDF